MLIIHRRNEQQKTRITVHSTRHTQRTEIHTLEPSIREGKGNFDNVLRREQQNQSDRTTAATAIIEDSNTANIALSSRHVYTPQKTGHRQHNIDSRNTLSL
jgi:hypothetical protein